MCFIWVGADARISGCNSIIIFTVVITIGVVSIGVASIVI